MLKSEYIFVYGSLISKGSEGLPGISNIPVTVSGLRRGWFTAVPEDATTGLGAIVDETRSCNGVLIKATDEYLLTTDDREIQHGYTRVKLPRGCASPWYTHAMNASDIWVYLTNTPVAPTQQCPITQSYLDVVVTGCLEIGKDFAVEFVLTTDGWDNYWVNDRDKPRYRRHMSADAERIDTLLSTVIPIQFANRISASN